MKQLDVDKIEESIQRRLLEYPALKLELKVKDAELKSVNELGLKYQKEQDKLIEGLKNVRDRARIAQLEEDEWGWAQALKSIQRQIGELFKEFGVTME